MQTIIKKIALLVLCIVGNTLIAQAGNGWKWVREAGNITSNMADTRITGSQHDAWDNLYICGYFTNTLTLDTLSRTSNGKTDLFIAKFDTSGKLLWLRTAGGYGNDNCNAIAVDDEGSVYATGVYTDSITIGQQQLNAIEHSTDVFVIKYNKNGILQYAKSFGGNINDYCGTITVDANKCAIASGNYGLYTGSPIPPQTAYFDSITLYNPKGSGMFIAKLDTLGNAVWVKSAIGYAGAHVLRLDFSGNIYLYGGIGYYAYFDSIKLTPIVQYYSGGNYSIVKFDKNGKCIWGTVIGSEYDPSRSGAAYPSSMAVSPDGSFAISGTFQACRLKIGGRTISARGARDMFVAGYDSSGKFLWVSTPGNYGLNLCQSLTRDNAGNTYMSGFIFEGCYFDTDTIFTNGVNADGFVVKYNASGKEQWVKSFGDVGAEQAVAITALSEDNLYVSGFYTSDPCYFDNIGLSNTANNSIFIGKIEPYATSVANTPATNEVVVYPNPSTGQMSIQTKDRYSHYSITDIVGHTIQSGILSDNQSTITVANFTDGYHVLKITDKHNNTQNIKLMLQH